MKIGGVELLMSIDAASAQKIRSSILWQGAKDIATPTKSSKSAPVATNASPEVRMLLQRISEIEWYQTLDLGNGITTPGAFDHSRELSKYPIPDRLDGMRALDIATYDGYWAFEFERRGAAEVIATDIGCMADLDLSEEIRSRTSAEQLAKRTGAGFNLMKEALHSKVRREIVNVYDLSPERIGKFDFVFCSDLLLHLKNPMSALESIRSVVRGEAVLVEGYSPFLPERTVEYRGGTRRCVWWSFGLGSLEQMIRDAGFREVTLASKFKTGHRGDKSSLWRAAFRAKP
jgi:tRNA (mo5U34)-methyltransferase